MINFIKKNLSLFSFISVPIIFLWNPSWLGFLGVQPYWPLFWLLPWSMIHGSNNGLMYGLFFGLILDSITIDNNFTQIPGLILCGLWFGKLKHCNNIFVEHFRYGLVCAIGSLLCSTIYYSQILIKNISEEMLFVYSSSIKNILAQVFITGLLAPLFCSKLLILFKKLKDKKTY